MKLPVVNRSCGTCTACCTTGGVPELAKPINVTCQHVQQGCSIYPDRPDACRDFECLWLRGFLPEKFRPNDAGVVFDYDEPPKQWMVWAYLLRDDAYDRAIYLRQKLREPFVQMPMVIVKADLICPIGGSFKVRGLGDSIGYAESVY